MRAPSQLNNETAAAYAVMHKITLPDGSYVPGQFVDGKIARSWDTFRSMLGLHWLAPATGEPVLAELTVPVTKPASHAKARGRRA